MIFEIIKQLEATASKLEKLAILNAHKNNDDLKEFFYLCLEPSIVFGIKKIPIHIPDSLMITSLMDACYNMVNVIASRKKTGNAAIEFVSNLLCRLSPDECDLLIRIINKSPDCGVSDKTINKIWPKLITIVPYMRCAACNDDNLAKIVYPAIVQEKADGLFINGIKRGVVNLISRNGKPIDLLGNLIPDINDLSDKNNWVVLGEGLVLINKDLPITYDNIMPRKLGNAIIGKGIKGKVTISKEEAERVVFGVWDIVPYEDWKKGKCTMPYHIRLFHLKGLLEDSISKKIFLIKTKEVENLFEAEKFYEEMLYLDREGAVLKNMEGIFKGDTSTGSKDAVKMKPSDPADLLCTGTYPHKKNKDWIGGINLESACGKIKVNCGTGISNSNTYKVMAPEDFIGNIIETEYNEIISDKKKDTFSLFLPSFQGIRIDKDTADTYEEILEKQKRNQIKKQKEN